MIAQYFFSAKIWRSGAGAGWFFVTLPEDLTMPIRTRALGLMNAFGSLRVSALVGETKWDTSIFFDTKAKAFVLPLKADVRRKEKLGVGDVVTCSIEFGGYRAGRVMVQKCKPGSSNSPVTSKPCRV